MKYLSYLYKNVCDISKWRLEVENEMDVDRFKDFMRPYRMVYNLYDIKLRCEKYTKILDKNRKIIGL